MSNTNRLSPPGAVNNELADILAAAPSRLSPTGPLMSRLERRVALMGPSGAFDVYLTANEDERRKIAHLVAWKLSKTNANQWSAQWLKRIEQNFGLHLLGAPGSVDR